MLECAILLALWLSSELSLDGKDTVMIQKCNTIRRIYELLSQSPLLAGICWLGGISILSAGAAFAQTPTPSDIPAVPSAQDLLYQNPQAAPPEAAPPEAAPAPLEAAPAPENPAPPSVSIELEQSAPERSAAPEAASASPSPATDSIDSLGGAASPPLVAPNLADNAKAAFGNNGAYIDSTPYSLGATANPEVVLSERSTGCQTVLQPGQAVPNHICPPVMAAESSSGSNSVSVGPMSLSVYGIGPGSTTPSGRDYYNLTMRPPARLGNGNISLLFPLSIPAAITSAFGWRIHPISGESRFHSGTDLGAPMGTPVLAAFAGKVTIADLIGGYGLAVVLDHNKGTEETLYGHMSEVFVKPGETVRQGEVIGRVGSTGYSTGPHLHFEFRKLTSDGWVVMDPGSTLQYALAQLVKSLQFAQADPQAQAFLLKTTGFTKALQMAEAAPLDKVEAQPKLQIDPR
jgi:murein DD-endopeptidase MepM/ murein hydrolase activator NlpD